jgi:hypothetical protein
VRFPRGKLWRSLFALLFALHGTLAAAHCLKLASGAHHQPFHVEICTGDGLVVLDLGGGTEPAPDSPGAHAGFCPDCHALPQAVLPAAPSLSGPAEFGSARLPRADDPSLLPGSRAPPYHPTGPPALS